MNDTTAFERDLAEAFDRESRGRPVPDVIHDELLTYAGRTRQRPSWLASIKEPPMRHSDTLAVGSPTVRIAATMAATLLLILAVAAAGIAGQRLFAAEADHIVDADGGGDIAAIADAVAVAVDGESILVRDGTYTESVTITEDITLFGESRDGVIIEFGAGCRLEGESEFWWEKERICEPGVLELDGKENTLWQPGPYALHLVDSDANLRDLTFRHLSPGYGIYVTGGAPTIERVTYADSTIDNPNGGSNLMLRGGTTATVRDSDIGAFASFAIEDRSPATVEDNVGGGVFIDAPRDEASGGPGVVRNNTLSAMIWADGMNLIEGNEITLSADDPFESAGIFIGGPGSGWAVEGNTVRNSRNRTGAIDVGDLAGAGVIIDNVVEGSLVGILSSSRSVIRIEANHVTDGETGIRALTGPVELIGNTVEGMTVNGIILGDIATLTGNVACGSATDLFISRLAAVEIDDTNEFCVVDDKREE